MLISISTLVKNLDIESFQLREWEKRGWLGDVMKDPKQNNQRVYTEEQINKIELINNVIKKQREKGLKRTDFVEVEKAILEEFGGEVVKMNNELVIHSNSVEALSKMILLQNRMIIELQEKVEKNNKLELIQTDLEERSKREEKLLQLVEELKTDIKELKEEKEVKKWWKFFKF